MFTFILLILVCIYYLYCQLGDNALHCASHRGSVEITNLFINHGLQVNSVDNVSCVLHNGKFWQEKT